MLMSRVKRLAAVAAAVAVVGSTFAVTSPVLAGPGNEAPGFERLSGSDRFATATDIALHPAWSDLGDEDNDIISTVIVNGNNFPDGLAASVIGNRILMVEQNSIPASTQAFFDAVNNDPFDSIGGILVVGGSAAVSDAVLEQLDAINGAEGTNRIFGADRYATALALADAYAESFEDEPGFNGFPVVLATGTNFPDALAAGSIGLPIVLNRGDSLLPEVREFFAGGNVREVYIVGGVGVVPASVEAEIENELGLVVERLAGDNRDETAVALTNIYDLIVEGDVDISEVSPNVILVNGLGFADALAAGPFARRVAATILTVRTNSIPPATAGFHVANCSTIQEIYAVGGASVISDAVIASAVEAATCVAP
jgi:putative cell wall-binding protein